MIFILQFTNNSCFKLQICTDNGLEVPDGQSGEVCLRGPSVMSGYIDNPEANADSYFEGGWFRTGDVGFLTRFTETKKVSASNSWTHSPTLAAGPWLTLTGRTKELINRGGEKVSPAEVEAVVMGVEGVKAAVCFPMPDETYGEQVAVAVVSGGSIGEINKEASATLIFANFERLNSKEVRIYNI